MKPISRNKSPEINDGFEFSDNVASNRIKDGK
jgi:hypothetical protein